MSDEQVNESVEKEVVESTSSDWRSSISEEFRGDDILKDVKSIDDLAKGYIHAQRSMGSMVRIPGEDAGEEQLNAFYSKLEKIPGVVKFDEEDTSSVYEKLGKPSDVDGYEIKQDLPADTYDSEQLGTFKNLSHELGLNNSQFNKLLEFEQSRMDHMIKSREESRGKAEEALKSQWGNDYANRLAGAKAAIETYKESNPEAVEALVNSEAGNNPVFLQILSELGKNMQESGHPNLQNSTSYGMTPDDAKAKIEEIIGNKSHPYHDRKNPAHEAAVVRVKKLYEAAYPGEL